MLEHEWNVKAGRSRENPATAKVIREILNGGQRVCTVIAQRFKYLEDARRFEAEEIARLKNCGITNILSFSLEGV